MAAVAATTPMTAGAESAAAVALAGISTNRRGAVRAVCGGRVAASGPGPWRARSLSHRRLAARQHTQRQSSLQLDVQLCSVRRYQHAVHRKAWRGDGVAAIYPIPTPTGRRRRPTAEWCGAARQPSGLILLRARSARQLAVARWPDGLLTRRLLLLNAGARSCGSSDGGGRAGRVQMCAVAASAAACNSCNSCSRKRSPWLGSGRHARSQREVACSASAMQRGSSHASSVCGATCRAPAQRASGLPQLRLRSDVEAQLPESAYLAACSVADRSAATMRGCSSAARMAARWRAAAHPSHPLDTRALGGSAGGDGGDSAHDKQRQRSSAVLLGGAV